VKKLSKVTAIALFALVAAIAAMLFSTAPAQAASAQTAAAQTASAQAASAQAASAQTASAQHLVLTTTNAVSPAACAAPKVDEELNGLWGNTCGDGFLSLYGEDYVNAVRSPSAPYHRIWFHQIADGGGLTACFYSTGQDIYPSDYVSEYGSWVEYPGDIQVSANTTPC
jgi:type II secretory pathway pseudopilin PulG